MKKLIRETEFGPEQFCRHCPDGGDWWPITDEFWFFRRKGETNGPCKACQAEHRAHLADKPCSFPGCNQPRHNFGGRMASRCHEHCRPMYYKREVQP